MIKVALCDDIIDYNKKMESYIEKYGNENHVEVKITSYGSGSQLLLNYQKRKFDVIFLDVSMPEMDGFETAEEIRKSDTDVSIVFCTSYYTITNAGKGFEVAAEDFLSKPLLYRKVENILKQNYHTDVISIVPKQISSIPFNSYNALILDFTMLHKYSLTISKTAKQCYPNIIVLFLCPTNIPEQIILDFYESGADDHLYSTLSSPALLLKKLNILFTNYRLATKYEDSHITLNFDSLTAVIEGAVTSFTPLEFKLLKLLSLNSNTVLTRQLSFIFSMGSKWKLRRRNFSE